MSDFNVLSSLSASQISQNFELAKLNQLQTSLNANGVQYTKTEVGGNDNVQLGSAQTFTPGQRNVVIGNGLEASANESVCIGFTSKNNAANSCVYGGLAENAGAQSCVIGHAAKNSDAGTHNVIYGNASETNGNYNTVLGTGNKILSQDADPANRPKNNVFIADGITETNVKTGEVGVKDCLYIGTRAPAGAGVFKDGSINFGSGANFAPAADNRINFGGDALIPFDPTGAGGPPGNIAGWIPIMYKGTAYKIAIYTP